MNPELPLVPRPIITRWGTWIEAAIFYSANFEAVKLVKKNTLLIEDTNMQIVDGFDANDSTAIFKAQAAFQNENVRQDLAFIQAHFKIIVETIKGMEAHGLEMNECATLFRRVFLALDKIPGPVGKVLQTKFAYVVDNNPDFHTISNIGRVLSGLNVPDFTMSPNLVAHYKYAPLTSCDVERSFSRYKTILADNRTSFLLENIEKHLICACESDPVQ